MTTNGGVPGPDGGDSANGDPVPTDPVPTDPDGDEPNSRRRLFILLDLGVAAIVVLALILLTDDDDADPAAAPISTTSSTSTSTPVPVTTTTEGLPANADYAGEITVDCGEGAVTVPASAVLAGMTLTITNDQGGVSEQGPVAPDGSYAMETFGDVARGTVDAERVTGGFDDCTGTIDLERSGS